MATDDVASLRSVALSSTTAGSQALVSSREASKVLARPNPRNALLATPLDEDTYTQGIRDIVERDYFPELPRHRAQRELSEALSSGDTSRILRAQSQVRMLSSTRGGGGATPSLRATPDLRDDDLVSVAPSVASHADGERKDITSGLRLDQYLRKFTSEDNIAASALLAKDKERQDAKYAWSVAREQEFNDQRTKLLENGRSGESNEVTTWKYKAINGLHWVPESLPVPLETARAIGDEVPISASNTRLRTAPSSAPAAKDNEPEPAWRMIGQPGRPTDPRNARYDLDSMRAPAPNAPPDSPKVGGYGLLLTPSPRPGVDATPLITWGNVASTPLRVEADSTDTTPGPSFRIADTTPRERAAQELAQRAAKRLRTSANAQSPLLSRTASPGSGVRRVGSPGSVLSSAGKRLASQHRRRSRSDASLRSLYSSPALRPPATPRGGRPPVPPQKKPPRPPTVPTAAAAAAADASLTDNLLEFK